MGRLTAAWQALTAKRDLASEQIGWQYRDRARTAGVVAVTQESALRSSAVWACLRLRADLESTLPVDVFRMVDGRQVEVPKPGLMVEPYPGVDITEHLYSSRMDLDRYGNSVGVIEEVDRDGRPSRIQLAPMADVTARCKGYRIQEWRINGEKYSPELIWHERQYTVGGWPMGLSPIAYAAWSIGGYLSAQQFAADWFGAGAMPVGTLRNTRGQVTSTQAAEAKGRFKAAVANRDIFVHGADWEWNPAATDAQTAGFLEERKFGVTDVCRFLGVPADMIDAPNEGSSITYANITQRNVQLLVTNLGPPTVRRERKWSTAVSRPRFVKLNTDALLRMDPEAREKLILARVAGRTLAPSEARALADLPPFTDEQMAEFDRLFGAPRTSAAPVAPPVSTKGTAA
jgi:HK97 family phage portal protein